MEKMSPAEKLDPEEALRVTTESPLMAAGNKTEGKTPTFALESAPNAISTRPEPQLSSDGEAVDAPESPRVLDQETVSSLLSLVRGRSSTRIRSFFREDPSFCRGKANLMQVVDSEGFSLLHIAVFKKYSGDVERVLLQQIKETCKDKEKIKRYLGMKTKNEDGHTALHLASFHGNFSAIKFLIEEGADP